MLWERSRVHRLVQSLLALGLVTCLFASAELSAESTRSQECPEMRQALRVMSLLKVLLTHKMLLTVSV